LPRFPRSSAREKSTLTHRTNSRGDPYSYYKNGHPLLAAPPGQAQRDWEGPRSCDDSENPIVISPRSLSLACSSGDWSSDEDLPDLEPHSDDSNSEGEQEESRAPVTRRGPSHSSSCRPRFPLPPLPLLATRRGCEGATVGDVGSLSVIRDRF